MLWVFTKSTKKQSVLLIIDENDYLNWSQIHWTKAIQLGGEPAGDIYTNNLKPEKFTLYTTETRLDLIRQLRIIPDDTGDINIYNKFWQQSEDSKNVVTPILAYADLVNTGNKRNIEIAIRIFHEHIQNQL